MTACDKLDDHLNLFCKEKKIKLFIFFILAINGIDLKIVLLFYLTHQNNYLQCDRNFFSRTFTYSKY